MAKSGMTFSIDGLKELEAALEQIPKRATQVATMRRALSKAAEPMRDAAKSYVSTSGDGDLEDGIRIGTRVRSEAGNVAYHKTLRSGGDKGQAVQAMRDARRAAKASGLNPAIVLFMGPSETAFYAKWVEYGTGPRVQKTTGKSTGRAMPEPFMRPAFDKEAKPTLDRIKPLLWQEIQRSVARAARKAAKNGN